MSRRKLTKEEFIARARGRHGNKYCYDKVEYKGILEKVIITCPKHGDFPQVAKQHLDGYGCKECANEARMKTTKEFIRDAREVHGDKFGYDNVEYRGWNEKVIITCPIHGDFPMTPNNHMAGKGCPICARKRRVEILKKHTELQTKTTEEFIKEAREIHGEKYNYENVKYVNSYTPVFITCPIHGGFSQKPDHHLRGCGCYKCNQSHLETETRILLEENNIEYEPQKTFPWLKNKREMPLDFYLPEYNIAIECQGIQHYLINGNGYFSDEDIRCIQQRDSLKYKLCQEHGIPIYYIKYNENVEWKIHELLAECNTKLKL